MGSAESDADEIITAPDLLSKKENKNSAAAYWFRAVFSEQTTERVRWRRHTHEDVRAMHRKII